MIIRLLKIPEIVKKYKGRKINKNHRWSVTMGRDYIVISMEIVIELEKNAETSVRYWIINDEESLIPYDAYNFKIIDPYIPKAWEIDLDKIGIGISHPKWSQYGYVEDYFDDIKVEKEYNKIVKEIFYESIEAAKKNGVELNLGIKDIWKDRLSD